jgi:hypothetical protein
MKGKMRRWTRCVVDTVYDEELLNTNIFLESKARLDQAIPMRLAAGILCCWAATAVLAYQCEHIIMPDDGLSDMNMRMEPCALRTMGR